MSSPPRPNRARFWASFALANLIGAFFLWLTAQSLPWEQVKTYAASADWSRLASWSFAFIALYIICHGARVIRWYELVKPLDSAIPASRVHRVCAVGFSAILLLPLRLGELVRPYLLARKSHLSISAVLGTVVVERVVDGLIMTGLLFVTLLTYQGDAQGIAFAYGLGGLSACVFLGALTVCLGAYWRKAQTVNLVLRLAGLVSQGLARRLADMLSAFIDGLRALVEARSLGRFVGLTILYWATNMFSMWVLARHGFGLDVGLWDMTTVMALLVIGIMIPAGPAMAGNFEFFMTRALGLFVVQEVYGAPMTAFAALVHVLQFVVIVLPGVVVMWSEPASRDLIALSEEARSSA